MTNKIFSDIHSRTRVLHYLYIVLHYFHIKICVPVHQKYLTCIPREHKSFWQLSRLNDFTINANANLFVHERLKIPRAYSEPIQTSKMKLFAKIIHGSKSSKNISTRNCKLLPSVLRLPLPHSLIMQKKYFSPKCWQYVFSLTENC